MTKQIEIHFNELSENVKLLITLGVMALILLVGMLIFYDNSYLQSQIDQLPKKVCHNETYGSNDTLICTYKIYGPFRTYEKCINETPYQKEVCEIK